TGLGLSTCHGIVQQSGGWIDVVSAPGAGTCFKIHLPLATDSASRELIVADSADLPGGSETVLVVEDEPAVRALTARTLRELGYDVIEAANGFEAQILVGGNLDRRIDLLLTDVVMPVMGG